MADPGFVICRSPEELKDWKIQIMTKYGWSQIVQNSEKIIEMGSILVCYAEGIV
jgi:hypothetical protein